MVRGRGASHCRGNRTQVTRAGYAKSRKAFRARCQCSPSAADEVIRTACSNEPCAPLALSGQGAASPRTACSGLRVVYGGVRHARSEGGESTAGGVGVMNTSQYAFADRAHEQQRLASQAELFDPLTERVFRTAG